MLLLATPAPAQTYLGSVSDNRALSGASTASYPNGVVRRHYAAHGDAPPLLYEPSGSACSLNGGDGDGGSQVRSSDGKCWLAQYPTAGVDSREFGLSPATGRAAANTSALNAASATAFNAGLPLVIGGGKVPLMAGFTLYNGQDVRMLPGTCLVMQEAGAAIATLHSPGAAIGYINADNLILRSPCVDMNYQHGTPFLNRGGRHVTIEQPITKNWANGAWKDSVGVTDIGTVTSGSATITELTRNPAVEAVGMVVSDPKGCIPANDQIAGIDGNQMTLVAAPSGAGCNAGISEPLTMVPVLPDLGVAGWLGYHGYQQPAYGTIDQPYAVTGAGYGRSFAELIARGSDRSQQSITFARRVPMPPITAMTQNHITGGGRTAVNGVYYATFNLAQSIAESVAAGSIVCVRHVTPSVYNVCGPAARGTLGSTLVLSLNTKRDPGSNPSGASASAYYGGSFIVDYSNPLALPAQAFVTSISDRIVYLDIQPPDNLQDTLLFTTGQIGVLGIATGDDSNPNILNINGGAILGFNAAAEEYQGGPFTLADTDCSVSGWCVVIGGSGRGPDSSAVAAPSLIRSPYSEYQAMGNVVLFTPDAQGGCTGVCASGSSLNGGFPSPSLAGGGTAYVLDYGTGNSYASVPQRR